MSMSLRELLERWGFEEDVVRAFEVNQVTVRSLAHLSDADVKELVPLIGPRNEMKMRISEWKDRENNNGSSSRSGLQLNQQQTNALNDLVSEYEGEFTDNASDKQSSSTPGPGSAESSRTCATPGSATPSRTHACASLHTSTLLAEKYDLKAVLNSTSEGKMVIVAHESQGKLTDSLRNKLAKVIVNAELGGDLNKRITKERAKLIASKVAELFPKELQTTWFRIEETNQRKVVKGRIMRFYSLRRELIKTGILDRADDDSSSDVDTPQDEFDDTDDCVESLAWLKGKNMSPWTRVLSAWTATSKARMRELQKPVEVEQSSRVQSRGKKTKKTKVKTSNAKVSTYTKEFPQILHNQGWTLLELDFEMYQKDSVLKLTLEFPKLEKLVLMKLKEMDRDMLYDDFEEKSFNERNVLIFLSLSKLFPIQTVATPGRGGGKGWRPSRQEVRDAFLLHVKSEADLDKTLGLRKKKLQDNGLTDQPLPIIIGTGFDELSRCIVKFDQCEYELETPLKAVDIALKSYHALRAEYPAESHSLWLFLQKAVYKFSTKWDGYDDTVERLIREFEEFEG